MTTLQDDRGIARIAGAAHRYQALSEDIDQKFFSEANGSIARFVFASKEMPAVAVRQLVAADLMAADNPLATALQEKGPSEMAEKKYRIRTRCRILQREVQSRFRARPGTVVSWLGQRRCAVALGRAI